MACSSETLIEQVSQRGISERQEKTGIQKERIEKTAGRGAKVCRLETERNNDKLSTKATTFS